MMRTQRYVYKSTCQKEWHYYRNVMEHLICILWTHWRSNNRGVRIPTAKWSLACKEVDGMLSPSPVHLHARGIILALLALSQPLLQTALAIRQIMPDDMCVCPCKTAYSAFSLCPMYPCIMQSCVLLLLLTYNKSQILVANDGHTF